jgi:hypothetical protein
MNFTLFEKYLAWIKAHEKLIIIGVLVLFSIHVYDSARTAWIDHDKRQADVATQVAAASSLQSAQVQEQLADLKKQVQATDASLKASMAQRIIDVQKQKASDDALAGQELANRLQALLHVTPPDVTWSPVNGNLVFTPPAAHAVADAVDDKNKLTADNADLQTRLTGQESVVAKQNDAIVSGNLALADEKTSHEKDITLLKAQMHGQYTKGLKHGIIIGSLGTIAAQYIFHIKL